MRFVRIVLVFILMFNFVKPDSTEAQTDEGRVTQFRQAALETLLNASPACLAKIPYVSIAKIRSAAVFSNISVARIEAAGRNGGLWTKNHVSFNPDFFVAAPKISQAILSIHEFIGQSHGGYVDDGYSFSIAIALCSQPVAAKLVGQLTWPKAYLEKIFVLEARAGGSTVVGGGGDFRDIQIKIEAIQALLQFVEAGHDEFLSQPIIKILNGLLLVNIYRAKEAAQGHFNIYIPHGRDRHIQSLVLVHPETFDAFYALPSDRRIVQMVQLAILFSNRVLGEKL